jgi:hypothetical protein
MYIKEIEKELIRIVNKRNELSQLGYDSEQYDDVEEELHDMEDGFISKYGEQVEEILYDIHDEFCPDSEVLSPLAYLAKSYNVTGNNENGPTFGVSQKEGVFVEMEDFPDEDTRLVIIPNPLRVVMNRNQKGQQILWPSA